MGVGLGRQRPRSPAARTDGEHRVGGAENFAKLPKAELFKNQLSNNQVFCCYFSLT
jgi:hypothetical protein